MSLIILFLHMSMSMSVPRLFVIQHIPSVIILPANVPPSVSNDTYHSHGISSQSLNIF
jgi:hypothetical protein